MQICRRILYVLIILIPGMFIAPITAQSDLTAKEIVQKATDKMLGKTSIAEQTMEIVRPDWSRAMSMQSWSEGVDYYLILITEPARDKGQVFLMRKPDMWNWVPTINRMIKIPPSMMTQAWMGSDFSNNDLVRINSLVEDYDHEITGSETIDGYDCHKIDLMPKADSPVVWGKVIMWISKKEFFENKIEYYDESFELINVMTSTEMKKMGDRIIPTKLTMSIANKPGNQTILITTYAEFNKAIDKNFFSEQNMKRVRPRR